MRTAEELLDWLDESNRRWTFWLGRSEEGGYTVWPVFPGKSIRQAINEAIDKEEEYKDTFKGEGI